MKKTSVLVFSLITLVATAQPNKLKYDSSKLINNTSWGYYSNNSGQVTTVNQGSVTIPQSSGGGLVLDANRNLVVGLTPHINPTSVNNKVLADNVTIDSSDDNTVTAKNAELYNTDGATVTGADHHLYRAQYSDVGNDANNATGESIFIRGSGNWSANNTGAIIGMNNYQGGFSWEEVLANRHRYAGGALIGLGLKSKGNFVTMFGYNYSSTVTGFHVGYGKDQLSVLPGDLIVINGVQYHWPATQPQPGSVLTYTGNSNLEWLPPVLAAQRQTQQQTTPKTFIAYTSTGQRLYLVEVRNSNK